jgi:2-polyprenyl-3-methyl-5-hydroxy-6-metoxy-1,4-benzoquinol methylase
MEEIATQDVSENNSLSWNSNTYNAWVERFGAPAEIAGKIVHDPGKYLSSLKDIFKNAQGKKILNIMGSNGIKGIALALLGARVTIVDFSSESKKYAQEAASAAGVIIEYINSDILKAGDLIGNQTFDIVFAEMGIVHYFLDLAPFMRVAYEALKAGGEFILKDFHPISTKLIEYRGTTAKVRKYKVSGNYFSESVDKIEVAFSKYLAENENKQFVYIRKWTLGEIVTSVAQAGLVINSLKEEPNQSSEVYDKGIPKTFTIVAKKAQAAVL